jgi:hypothetical protein
MVGKVLGILTKRWKPTIEDLIYNDGKKRETIGKC